VKDFLRMSPEILWRVIPNLSTTEVPLYHLFKTCTDWHWTNAEQEAFQAAKSLQVLAHYNSTQDFILACNASPYGVGVVLSHRYPIGYASRTLSAQRRTTPGADLGILKEGGTSVQGRMNPFVSGSYMHCQRQ